MKEERRGLAQRPRQTARTCYMISGGHIHTSLTSRSYIVVPPTETRYATGTMPSYFAFNAVPGMPPRTQAGCSIRMGARARVSPSNAWRNIAMVPGYPFRHAPRTPPNAFARQHGGVRTRPSGSGSRPPSIRGPGVNVVAAASSDEEPDTCPTAVPLSRIAAIRVGSAS
jgi:hypothetical protein